MAGLAGVLKFNSINERHAVSKDLHYLLYTVQNRGQSSNSAVVVMKNKHEHFPSHDKDVIKRHTFKAEAGNYYHFSSINNQGTVRGTNNKIRTDLWGEIGIGAVSNEKAELSQSLPYRFKTIAVAKDGWINNIDNIEQFLINEDEDVDKESRATKVLAKLFYHHYWNNGFDGLRAVINCVEGADNAPKILGNYSIIVLTPESIIACSNGKPLCYAVYNDKIYFSSSSTGLWTLIPEINFQNFEYTINYITPGKIIEVFRDGLINETFFETMMKPCAFEAAYFERPDAVLKTNDKLVEAADIRKRIGQLNAEHVAENINSKHYTLKDCLVVPVLESGKWYGLGIAKELNLEYSPALFKDMYSLKSFILSYQEERRVEVAQKHIPSAFQFTGKNLILTEDSIVRGTTLQNLLKLLRTKSGAENIHVFTGWPEKRYKCAHTSEPEKTLIANNMSIEDIRTKIGADTLTFGKLEYWQEILPDYCLHCTTGE